MPRRALCYMLVSLCMAALAPAHGQAAKTLEVDGDHVTILRDAYGVPHVFAGTVRGLFVGNGYAIAEDRLGQMELYRRTARGEMAALVGPSAVAADRETRIDGYTEDERQHQFGRLPLEIQAILTAYADGVNRYIAEVQSRPGAELKVANYPAKLDAAALRPWRVTDTLAIGQMMARRFGGGEGGELRNMLVLNFLKVAAKGNAYRLFNDALWRNDTSSPTTIPASEDPRATGFVAKPHWADATGQVLARAEPRQTMPTRSSWRPKDPRLRALQTGGGLPGPRAALTSPQRLPSGVDKRAALAAADMLDQRARLDLAVRLGLPTRWGSYCIAVSAGKSATGNAMLVGGPQMGFRTPQIAHEVHLSGDGIDVIGMGFAGVPGVLIGATPDLAWSTTTGVNDQTDVFIEQLDPNDPTRYRYNGEWRKVEERAEEIEVAGEPKQSIVIRRTVHGPIVQEDAGKHIAYARMSTYWQRENDTFAAILGFTRARNVREFGAACALIPTSHNFLCATRDGDIGFWFCGLSPIRAPGIDPRLPTPGDGSKDWRGMVPFDRMPHLVNPKQGFLCNWNNKPSIWWDNADTPVWGRVFHNGRIADLLAARTRIAPEDLRNILLDIGTNDYSAQVLLPLLNEATKRQAAKLTPAARRAAGYLAAWDCHATEGSVAATIFNAWLQQVREELFGKPFGFIKIQGQAMFDLAMQPSLIYHVLMDKRSPVPIQSDYLHGSPPDAAIVGALVKAVAALEKRRGPEMARWTSTRGQIGFSPLPPIPWTDRGTYIQIVEATKAGPHGVDICPPGQSERTDSPHFGDQREIAGWFQFKPMLTDRAEIEKVAPR